MADRLIGDRRVLFPSRLAEVTVTYSGTSAVINTAQSNEKLMQKLYRSKTHTIANRERIVEKSSQETKMAWSSSPSLHIESLTPTAAKSADPAAQPGLHGGTFVTQREYEARGPLVQGALVAKAFTGSHAHQSQQSQQHPGSQGSAVSASNHPTAQPASSQPASTAPPSHSLQTASSTPKAACMTISAYKTPIYAPRSSSIAGLGQSQQQLLLQAQQAGQGSGSMAPSTSSALSGPLASAASSIMPPAVSTWMKRLNDDIAEGMANLANKSNTKPTPEVARTDEEKDLNPERLNLNRKNLYSCLLLSGEERLRLLNYQSNFISKIENLTNLRNLVFLDFYNNHIERISGLSHLQNLRVLMLGRNRIRRIEGLENLNGLDVLDLHSNQISVIENISHLSELRVLNLEDNRILEASNFIGLSSVAELNLRRNQIALVKDVASLQNLRRLILSINTISSLDSIQDIYRIPHLIELCIDSNPIIEDQYSKPFIIHKMKTLKLMDGKRIGDDERRAAAKISKREADRKRESDRLTFQLEERKRVIADIKRKWEAELANISSKAEDSSGTKPDQPNVSAASAVGDTASISSAKPLVRAPSAGKVRRSAAEEVKLFDGQNAFVELQNGQLSTYGDALAILDRLDYGSVVSIHFSFVNFSKIVQVLPKLRRFPNLESLTFSDNMLNRLKQSRQGLTSDLTIAHGQINHLCVLRGIKELDIVRDQNIVSTLPLFRPYTLFRLSHLPLKRLCGVEVTESDWEEAQAKFGPLRRVVEKVPNFIISKVPDYQLPVYQAECLDDISQTWRLGTASPPEERAETKEVMSIGKAVSTKSSRHRNFVHSFVQSLVKESLDCNTKLQLFNELWPKMIRNACLRGMRQANNPNVSMSEALTAIILKQGQAMQSDTRGRS
ncbi:uncharacterized protein BJ171DRAFT_598127 [Polychytrium aggregatum]|uniref:uncharacterized protein n=1 Tax=Polychytrium aggregatum TaxID=110093 RepID=UPI0022FEFE58|nr:uncharacterized protein BJ171DRAFT_598127 [Polychytrium aggregatum]KAI9205944.1 hypothetical protein BJ171DRAFT_598127 [Polychytrium aggregatum]